MTLNQLVLNTTTGLAHLIATQAGLITKTSTTNDTGTNTTNGKYIVFRIGVVKDSLNTTTAQFVSMANSIEHSSLSAANAGIQANTITTFPTEIAPTLTTTVGHTDIVRLLYVGTTWYGFGKLDFSI